jgi:multiple sugar transport system ATP-binding protein
MTVFDNIAYALRLKRMEKNEINKIVNEVAQMVHIDQLLERYPSQLSGGQQQRVAVARAIAVKPKIFLMDEPLSNLDAKLRGAMRTELKAIHASTGATSVFVTHDQSEAMSMADRIVIMKDGEIVQIGSPDDVYHDSGSIFVADFIGTPPTNFFEVLLKRENGKTTLANPHFSLDLDDKLSKSLERFSKPKLVLGVRPENIILVNENQASLSAQCLVSEPQGSHQIVAINLDQQIIKVVTGERPTIEPGSTLHLSFKMDTILFFDKETGLRVH